MTDQWEQAESGTLGPLELRPDGHFSIFGMTFDQSSGFEECTFGNAQIDKPPGEGQVLKVSAPDQTHFLKYESGMWYYRSSQAGGTAEAGGTAAGKGRKRILATIMLAVAFAFVLWRFMS